MDHKCKHDGDFKEIATRLEAIPEIQKDVKSLLAFKWQILGGAGVFGLVALIVQVYFSIKNAFAR